MFIVWLNITEFCYFFGRDKTLSYAVIEIKSVRFKNCSEVVVKNDSLHD